MDYLNEAAKWSKKLGPTLILKAVIWTNLKFYLAIAYDIDI